MQNKNYKESSIIGVALGVIVATLTTWLVMLLRQRTQPANNTRAIGSLVRRDGAIGNKISPHSGWSNGKCRGAESARRSGTSLHVQRRCGLFIRKKKQNMESAYQVHDRRWTGHLHLLGSLF